LLLRAIRDYPIATLGELAEKISLSQATATTILNRLETMDLAKRYRSELDRRKLHVELTEKGKGILENAPLPLQAQFIEQFEGLKTFEQTAILSSLQQVAEMMQTQSASRSGETDVLQLVTSSEVAKPAA
jgi:DNA-binding MarR family transcriptional regulator